MQHQDTKCIMVALAGPPNAGKSTLLNLIVGQKISIISPKQQTTRFNTRGIVNFDNVQIIFIDTPGLFKASRPLEERIVKNAQRGIREADLVCLICDCKHLDLEKIQQIGQRLQKMRKPYAILLNKIDKLKDKKLLLPMIASSNNALNCNDIFPISARYNKGVSKLLNFLKKQAQPGPWYFDEEQVTDISQKKLAEEITRQHLFCLLQAELPYNIEVQTQLWDQKNDESIAIYQVIHVFKNSQKKIILGTGGQKIKEIAQRARIEIAKVLDQPVHLFIHIKIKPDWIKYSDL